MKRQFLTKSLSVLASTMLMLMACHKETDNKKEWGKVQVYMPQAAILNGGTNNNYPVPLNNNPSTRNYMVDSAANTIQVVLGVARSGLQPLEGFSVQVVTDLDTTNQIIAAGSIANAVLLPVDVYTLPANVEVPDGKRDAVFYLTIDRKMLMEKYATYNDKKLVLTVGIGTASKDNILLNAALSKTVVVIDARSFMQ